MREEIFDRLAYKLHKKASEKPQITRAMIELTYGCNLRCVHCYNPTHEAKNEVPTQELIRILDELAGAGCVWVGFTGGELFTRKDAMQVLRHAKGLGFVISILSNATLIIPQLADEIQALEPFQVDISMYGATEETYRKVTGIPGSFERFLRGVDLLNERKVPMLLKLILMTLNLHELDRMREIALSRKIRSQLGMSIYPRVDGVKAPLAYRLSPEQVFEIWRKYKFDSLSQKPAPEETGHDVDEECEGERRFFDCACGKSSVAVTPYGRMNLCLSIYDPQYDLVQGSVAEGWESLVDRVRSVQPGPRYECQGCDLYHHCDRDTKDGWLEQGVFDGECLSYFRGIAEMKRAFTENRKR